MRAILAINAAARAKGAAVKSSAAASNKLRILFRFMNRFTSENLSLQPQ